MQFKWQPATYFNFQEIVLLSFNNALSTFFITLIYEISLYKIEYCFAKTKYIG